VIGREAVEHPLHAGDFGSLIHLDVGSQLEDKIVLGGSIGGE
jgi:hypothetical protein